MCNQFLASAAFSFDKDGGAGWGNLGDKLADFLHRGRFADQAFKPMLAVASFYTQFLNFVLKAQLVFFKRSASQGSFEEQLDLVEVERFGDEVPCSTTHSLDSGIY